MKILHKIIFIVVLPMLILSIYQFYSIESTFGKIEEARATIFTQSAAEIKFASETVQLTSLLNSTLFEVYLASISQQGSVEKAITQYREIQLVRYYSLQKLKETVSSSNENIFFFSTLGDSNDLSEITAIESKISKLDAFNETILVHLTSKSAGDENAFYPLIEKSNTLTKDVSGDLLSFVNREYVFIGETSKKVAETEKEGKANLYTVFVVGYILAFFMIIFFHRIVVKPLENFVYVIDTKDWNKVTWSPFDQQRTDEIGVLHRQIQQWMNLPKKVPYEKPKKKARVKRK